MLKFLRTHTNSWIMKVLLTLLVLSFGLFWGVAEFFRGTSGADVVGSVQRIKITKQHLIRATQAEVQRINTQLKNKNITFQQAVQFGFPLYLLTRMINETVLSVFSKDVDLLVNDRAIANMIISDPLFQGTNGQFSKSKFINILRANGMTEGGFMASRRQSLSQMNLVSAMRVGDTVPAAMAYPIFTHMIQKRTITAYKVKSENIPVSVSEKDCIAYYNSHGHKFRVPEYRTAEIVLLDPARIAKKARITEADLMRAYKDQKDSLIAPETRSFSVAVFKTQSKAKTAYKTGKISFSESHKSMAQETLAPEIGAVVFSLSRGKISKPFSWQGQYAIVRLNKVYPAKSKPFDTVKDGLAKDLKRQKALELIAAQVSKIEEGSNQGMSFQELSKAYKLPVQKFSITRKGEGRQGKVSPLQGDIISEIFSLPKGSETQLTELADGTSYMLRLVEVHPSHTKAYKSVKRQVRSALIGKKKLEAAKVYAEKHILKRGKFSTDIVSVRRFSSLNLHALQGLKNTNGIPKSVLANAFSLKKDAFKLAVHDNAVYVVKPTKIYKVDLSRNLGFYKTLKSDLGQLLSKDIYEGFLNDLKVVYGAHINNKSLQSLA